MNSGAAGSDPATSREIIGWLLCEIPLTAKWLTHCPTAEEHQILIRKSPMIERKSTASPAARHTSNRGLMILADKRIIDI